MWRVFDVASYGVIRVLDQEIQFSRSRLQSDRQATLLMVADILRMESSVVRAILSNSRIRSICAADSPPTNTV